jgi:hypothetical protein
MNAATPAPLACPMADEITQGKKGRLGWGLWAKAALLLIGESIFFSACTAFDIAVGTNPYLAVAISAPFSCGLVRTIDVLKGRER